MSQKIPSIVDAHFAVEATGMNGGLFISDTSVNTGSWTVIEAVTDATFTTLTGNISGAAGITLVAGRRLYGQFTAITLAGGSVVAYNAPF